MFAELGVHCFFALRASAAQSPLQATPLSLHGPWQILHGNKLDVFADLPRKNQAFRYACAHACTHTRRHAPFVIRSLTAYLSLFPSLSHVCFGLHLRTTHGKRAPHALFAFFRQIEMIFSCSQVRHFEVMFHTLCSTLWRIVAAYCEHIHNHWPTHSGSGRRVKLRTACQRDRLRGRRPQCRTRLSQPLATAVRSSGLCHQT